jgi:hypothetical protein
MPKSFVTLTFWKDGVIYAKTSAVVEDFNNAMFSADPEVDLIFICFDPDFYAPAVTVTNFTSTTATDTTIFNYPGNSDCGIIFTLNVNRSIAGVTLYNTQPDNTLTTFSISGAFLNGDVIQVNSIPGQKSATLTRGSITTSILALVDPSNAGWPVFQKGVNLFRASLLGTAIPCSVAYTAKYGGL